ncbi:MAG: hypothetical protein ACKO5F_13015 [Synechococcus sp.]
MARSPRSCDPEGCGDARGGHRSSSLVLSAVAGAALGAAGLAWWLLSEADRRRQRLRQERLLRLSRLQGAGGSESSGEEYSTATSGNPSDPHLHDKVQQLNQAIEEVRRQLESLTTAGERSGATSLEANGGGPG